jgi:hypothetical protein
MPAVSQKQQELMAIAEHSPEKVHSENRGVLDMSHKQLHDFAATSHKHIPYSAAHEIRKKK